MSLHTALSLFLDEYPKAISRPFGGDPVATFIRNDVVDTIVDVIGKNPRYIIKGSAGQGNWAQTPWAAIFDRFITESAQSGYYVVYLVREDFSGIYLSLNQGITSVKNQYGSEAKSALTVRSADYLARLGSRTNGLQTGLIDLAPTDKSNLSTYYQAGSICSKFYSRASIPDDATLNSDLLQFIQMYFELVSREAQLFEKVDAEDDESDLGEEDLRTMREHKRIERNRKLALRAKKLQGYICKACGFDFQERYGEIGKNFIEAHHLTPLSNLKGQRLTLDPKKDFTVLCSNCHRMIHKTAFANNVEQFRANYIVKPLI